MQVPLTLLLAAGILPWLGTVGSFLGVTGKRPGMGRGAAYAAMILSCLCSAGLALWFSQDETANAAPLRTEIYRLLSVQEPRRLTFAFGFEATLAAAVRATVAGLLFLATEWYFSQKKPAVVADNIRLIHSLLYAAIISYVFAPNVAQSLLSLCLIALAGTTLWHLVSSPPQQALDRPLNIEPQPSRSNEMALRRSGSFATRSPEASRAEPSPRPASSTIFPPITPPFEALWNALTHRIPNWLGEQVELVLEAAVPVRLLAILVAVMAVLLTWLLGT